MLRVNRHLFLDSSKPYILQPQTVQDSVADSSMDTSRRSPSASPPPPPPPSPSLRVAISLTDIMSNSNFILVEAPTTTPTKRHKPKVFQGISSTEVAAASILSECLTISLLVATERTVDELTREDYYRELKTDVEPYIEIALTEKKRLGRGVSVPELDPKHDLFDLVKKIQEHNENLGDGVEPGSNNVRRPGRTS
jgi:hypothetical protein